MSPPAPADPLDYPREGLRLARPTRWTAERRGGVIRLRSGDGRLGVAITAARREVDGPQRVRRDLVRAIRASRRGVRVESRSRTRLGDASALVTELSAPAQGGGRNEILVMATRSRWRVYGVTVFSRREEPTSTMPDLAAVLDSFEFRAPS